MEQLNSFPPLWIYIIGQNIDATAGSYNQQKYDINSANQTLFTFSVDVHIYNSQQNKHGNGQKDNHMNNSLAFFQIHITGHLQYNSPGLYQHDIYSNQT